MREKTPTQLAAELLKGEVIDSGYVLITRERAQAIAVDSRLPKEGYEKKAQFGAYEGFISRPPLFIPEEIDGTFTGWVTRTVYRGEQRWAVCGIDIKRWEDK